MLTKELMQTLFELFSEDELADLCRFKELDTKMVNRTGLSNDEYVEYEQLEETIKGSIFKSI